MDSIVNISTYKFVNLAGLSRWRGQLIEICKKLGLKGTILLSEEGINLNLAGSREAIDNFGDFLRAKDEFQDIVFKESLSETIPFRRLRVRIKKEIIKMLREDIQPANFTVPHLPPKEFKQWLDEGRDIVVLDTRNDYEIEFGTFEGALNLNIEVFTDFDEAVATQLAEVDKTKPIVSFCTGGVRCEKAGPALVDQGFTDVYQLDGGILNYFQECGGAHYKDNCFVFDDRIALKPDLSQVPTN